MQKKGGKSLSTRFLGFDVRAFLILLQFLFTFFPLFLVIVCQALRDCYLSIKLIGGLQIGHNRPVSGSKFAICIYQVHSTHIWL